MKIASGDEDAFERKSDSLCSRCPVLSDAISQESIVRTAIGIFIEALFSKYKAGGPLAEISTISTHCYQHGQRPVLHSWRAAI